MTGGLILFCLFAATALIQILYYLIYFKRVAVYQPPLSLSAQAHPVSVIVCSRDEGAHLERNLPGVLVQDYPALYEVIVVNDNSVDDSRFVLEEFEKRFKHLQVIGLAQEAKLIAGKKFPLSIGIKECKHDVVLLTDADCTPASEQWVTKMQEAYQPGIDVVLGYGAYYKEPGVLNKLIRWETFHTALQYFGFALAGTPYMGVGRNLSYRKELFFRNKGFSAINNLPGGDDDLFINKVARKDNTAVVLDADAFTFSAPKKTWKDWMRQKTRHYSTGKYYKRSHRFLLGLYAATLALFYPLFLLSVVFFDWRWSLLPFVLRLLLQGVILRKAMRRLGEGDLWPWFPLFDLWMLVYYAIFAPSLWRKPRNNW